MPKVSEIYKKLYHYTTWDGLQGILESQTLWATKYKFLNDYSELVLFKDKLISLVHPYSSEMVKKLMEQFPEIKRRVKEKGGIRKVVRHEAEALINAQYSALGDQIYILSFCGEHANRKANDNGLLSQWRGYGRGGGVAVVFDSKKLEGILELEASRFQYDAMLLADIVYSDKYRKLKQELSDDLSIIADVMKEFFEFENLISRKSIDSSKAFMPSFVKCISRYKHYGFSEENEVRVVALPTVIDRELEERAKAQSVRLRPEKAIEFRKRRGQLIPYIELFRSSDIELPIEKIIVGPHKKKEARAMALHAKLGKTNIEIACSEIPYVCQ